MASADSVKVLKVYQVAPPTNSTESSSISSLPITFFDARCLRFTPAERIYFYKPTELTPSFFHSEILPKLHQSLSHTLLHFLPLTGQLTWLPDSPKPTILYSQDYAVSLTVAESTADLDRLSSNGISETTELRPYIPELLISDATASILALQITLFPHKGFSIGISMNHAIVDGKSASIFLKAWAHICKSTRSNAKPVSLLPEFTPSFDRTVINDPDELESFYLARWQGIPGFDSDSNPRSVNILQNFRVTYDSVRATFQLSREKMDKLRKSVMNFHKNRAKDLHLSRVIITCAFVSGFLVKARGGERERKVCFFLPVDCRSRLNPQIPQNYFGNCLVILNIFAEAATFMEENGVAIIAEKISDSIKGIEKGIFQGEKHRQIRSRSGAEIQNFKISGSPQFEYYEEDFGWGKPEKVEITTIDRVSGISLKDSKDESGGIEIGLVLPRHEMEAFSSLFRDALNNL